MRTDHKSGKKFIDALQGASHDVPPVWMMRQAGRYLPEYRALREKAGSFLDLAYNPLYACEATLQPLRRFGMDAAILFSDILIVPHALGRDLRFEAGEGPRLNPLHPDDRLPQFDPDDFSKIASPVWDAVAEIKSAMARENFADNTALIGFAGAPWTVACYMVEGGGSRDFARVRHFAYTQTARFCALLDLLADATIFYLIRQIEAGAEAIQIFDSWAGLLDEDAFVQFVIAPTRKIVTALHAAYPHIPVIGFPRQAGAMTLSYIEQTGVQGLSIEPSIPAAWAARHLQPHVCVQGNLDPAILLAGGDVLSGRVDSLLSTLGKGPYIFNLGHGIDKDTPVTHVEQMLQRIRG